MFRKAEIIVVGSEFFTRDKPDTNSVWLAERLEEKGVHVLAKHLVADEPGLLAEVFRGAALRADLVISTGGLGPTADDRTRDAIAKAIGVNLNFHQSILDDISAKFQKRGRLMPENNSRQAYIPDGAHILENPDGTAPGFFLNGGPSLIVALPGPPREMSSLYARFCQRMLGSFPKDSVVTRARILKVVGLGESDMDTRIADLYASLANPEVTINFTPADIEIHLTARAGSAAKADALLEPLTRDISERLGEHLISSSGERLVEVVSRELKERGLTVAIAESITGGLVAEQLASVPGASKLLLGAIVAYSPQVKQSLLGVKRQTIEQYSVVSHQVAQEMALGAFKAFMPDIALAVTGYAGPTGGSERDPIGTAYLGMHWQGQTSSLRVSYAGDRELVRIRAAQGLMFWLYGKLLGR